MRNFHPSLLVLAAAILATAPKGSGADLPLPTRVVGTDASLFAEFGRLETADAVMALIAERKLHEASPEARSALCAVYSRAFLEELNQKLLASSWPGPFLLAADVVPPKQRSKPAPRVPHAELRRARDPGPVHLLGNISDTGKMRALAVSENQSLAIQNAVLESTNRSTFKPAKLGGRAVALCYQNNIFLRAM